MIAKKRDAAAVQKEVCHNIGRMSFDLILECNEVIGGKCLDVPGALQRIHEGLHDIEYKAERLAETLGKKR